MSVSPSVCENSPEPPISELRMNLENQFSNVQDLSKAEGMPVFARIRPMLNSEIEAGYKECIGIIDDQTVRAVIPASSAKYKSSSRVSQDIIEDFTFTAAYGPETGQFVFFQESMMNSIQNFIEGQNSLVFSYGTTGSGKTFTLQGDIVNPGIIPLSMHLFFASIENQLLDKFVLKPDKFADVIMLNDNEIKKELEIKEELLSACDQGEWNKKNSSVKSFAMVLCDTFSGNFNCGERKTTLCSDEMAQAQAAALMKELSKKSADQQTGYCNIWISFVEIYNESVYDLLQRNVNQRPKLTLGEDKNGDVYVKGIREVCVSNSYEALQLLSFGQRNLNIASTKLNYKSSRSHCIFTVKVVRVPDPGNITYAKVNRLSFCDLAGSERASKSETTGLRLKEAGCINTSLLVLGRCLEQLRLRPSLRDKKLIPFRESKLTRLFSGFFTGRGKAMMVTNASPSELTFDETLHVLRFSALAKELIINDSYIATASSTLQTITNIWASAKANASASSDKSISFEDSMEEIIQEKDELIEKLLDLAESLRNNLEREKKEKAALEIKIRQDVCNEYAEYSDELLESQRQNFEEERETIREIYKKRIAEMEKMYENIIKEYKLQLEEYIASDDEDYEVAESKNVSKSSEDCEHSVTDEFNENDGFEAETKISKNSVESNRTKEELHETVDYSLSLEAELETLRKELEDIKLQLQSAMKDNIEIKKELDACKIDCFAYRTSNECLLKEKSALEEDIKLLTEDLTSFTHEKEALLQNLAESEEKVVSRSQEIQNLLSRIDELVKIQEESSVNYEKANLKIQETSNELLLVRNELDEEKEKRISLEIVIKTMESKILELQEKEINYISNTNSAEVLSKEIDHIKQENADLKSKLENSEKTELHLSQIAQESKAELLKLKDDHLQLLKSLNDTEEEYKARQEIMKSDRQALSDTITLNKEQQEIIETLNAESILLKKEISAFLSEKEDLMRKYESAVEMHESEKSTHKEEFDDITKKLVQAESIINKQKEEIQNMLTDSNFYKNEIEKLKKLNVELHGKISQAESEKLTYKEEFDNIAKKLVEAESVINEQTEEMQNLLAGSKLNKNEIEKLQKLNAELERKVISKAESITLIHKQELEIMTKKLDEAQSTIDKQIEEIDKLLADSNCSKKEIIKLSDNLNKLNIQLKGFQTVCGTLYELIGVLQRCEVFATHKTKQLHTSNIKHVEKIMDLEKSLKAKVLDIESLKNDYNLSRKQLKESQSVLKKQIESEKKYVSEIDSLKSQQKIILEEKKSLYEKLIQIEAEKEKFASEILKLQLQKVSEKKEKQETTFGRKELTSLENIKSDAGVKGKENDRKSGKKIVKRIKEVKENRQNENTEKAQNKGLVSGSKTSTIKRKGQVNEMESSENKILKKRKLDQIAGNTLDHVENIPKPQDLRIKLLRIDSPVNVIPPPSPRMTRGRKKLASLQTKNLDQSTASPRSMRS